jgi:hypothetical protein
MTFLALEVSFLASEASFSREKLKNKARILKNGGGEQGFPHH